ncbi:MAG: hypothetical protein HC881_06975 [Leptolyngbyaceae cyanobacterium SL_7_1]|nr:hypothetical protein [Leptolyngbyaceae cyanobacterium SL_7_1]
MGVFSPPAIPQNYIFNKQCQMLRICHVFYKNELPNEQTVSSVIPQATPVKKLPSDRNKVLQRPIQDRIGNECLIPTFDAEVL